jgi:osmotically-inducible protein OsmY
VNLNSSNRFFYIVLIVMLVVGLIGCAPLIAGGAATGAVVTGDKRTTGTFIEDQAIETKAKDFVEADGDLAERAHINATSYNQRVLLTGEVPTEELKARAVEYVSRIAKVRHVYDELVIGNPSTTTMRANDTLITTKVKAKLVTIRDISATDIKVVTEAGVVYLMGLFDTATGDAIAAAVSTVGGITKVVKLFEAPK